MAAKTRSERAGALQRLLAMALDVIVASILVAAIGLAATAASGGKLRINNSVARAVACAAADNEPAGVLRCEFSILGFVYDRTLELPPSRDGGPVRIPLDAAGAPTKAIYLDGLLPFALALYCLYFEQRFGATPGKRVMYLRVRSRDGAPLRLSQTARRLLRLVAVAGLGSLNVPHAASASLRYQFGLTTSFEFGAASWLADSISKVGIVYGLGLILTALLRMSPLHDLWAGTEVVRAGD
jgi:uncharacterized RDD family membrane protein YckC